MKIIVFSFSFLFALHSWAQSPELPLPLPDDPPGQEDPAPPEPPPREMPPPEHGAEVVYSLGTGSTDRFLEKIFFFSPRAGLNYLKAIRLVSLDNKVNIQSVRVHFLDRGERDIPSLLGNLGPGGGKVLHLKGERIGRIAISASASYFWKKPGSFRVDVVALRSSTDVYNAE